jgi:hypothetical protein
MVMAVIIMAMRVIMIVAVFMVMAVGMSVAFPGADAFDMVVMTFLRKANLVLKTQYLFSVLTLLAIHFVLTGQNVVYPFRQCFEHQRVIVEVTGLDEFDFRVTRRHDIGVVVNAFDQYSGKQKIREDDNAFEAQARCMLQSRLDKGESDARIAGFRPA